jgi:hypothetical protein
MHLSQEDHTTAVAGVIALADHVEEVIEPILQTPEVPSIARTAQQEHRNKDPQPLDTEAKGKEKRKEQAIAKYDPNGQRDIEGMAFRCMMEGKSCEQYGEGSKGDQSAVKSAF